MAITLIGRCASLAALLLAVSRLNATPVYSVTDLGDLPGAINFSYPTDINNSGQVVGVSSAASGDRAFLWDPINGMQDLGDLPGGVDSSIAYDISDTGVVVGAS